MRMEVYLGTSDSLVIGAQWMDRNGVEHKPDIVIEPVPRDNPTELRIYVGVRLLAIINNAEGLFVKSESQEKS